MEPNGFLLRLRRLHSDGNGKKGPVVVQYPSSTAANPASQNGVPANHQKELRSPGAAPSRRRGYSPEASRGTVLARRPPPPPPVPRDSPRTSPKTSPKTSPVRKQSNRERSSSPVFRRPPHRHPRPSPPPPPRTPLVGPPRKLTPPTSPRAPHASLPKKADSSSKLGGPRTPVSPSVRKVTSLATPESSGTRPCSPNPPSGSCRPSSPGVRRPPSPGSSAPRSRGASPGSKGPAISEEALHARVQKALRARLYLLHQPGPNSFSVGGDSPSHKYKVIVGAQTCSCGHGPYCVHVLFIMVRVLQVPDKDPKLQAGVLKDYEVEQLLQAYEERRKKAVRGRDRGGVVSSGIKGSSASPKNGRSCPASPIGPPPSPPGSNSCDDDSQCPICLMCMVEGESLVACELGCHNLLHEHCMAVWAADRRAQGQLLLCPLCRAPWHSKSQPRGSPGGIPASPQDKKGGALWDARKTDASRSVMSSSFSGVTSGALNNESRSSVPYSISRSYSAMYPGNNDSAYSSPGISSSYGPVLGAVYPPTIRREISAAIVASVSEEPVPLPRSEPIPEEHENTAASWVHIFGRELVACLFSRDWVVRETGLRRLSHEVVKILHWDRLITGEQKRYEVILCCANILAQVANDPVYKVYLACLRCLRVLLSHLCPSTMPELTALQELLCPLLHTVLLKCADGNRRTSQISIDCIVEMSRGQNGELALGTEVTGGGVIYGLGGIEYVLSCILNDNPPTEAPWQWLLGRLCVLDRLVDEFPSEFQLQVIALNRGDSGYKLEHYDRLMTVVEFAFKALGSSHATVAKLARRVFIFGARFASAEQAVFHQVCDMLGKLDVSLQARLKRRLKSLQGNLVERRGSQPKVASGDTSFGAQNKSFSLMRSVSKSPSRVFSLLKSSRAPTFPGHSPFPSNTTKEANSNFVKETSLPKGGADPRLPRRPSYLPLDSFETKLKEKQLKMKLLNKGSKARVEGPVVAKHALLSNSVQSSDSVYALPKVATSEPSRVNLFIDTNDGVLSGISRKSHWLPENITTTPRSINMSSYDDFNAIIPPCSFRDVIGGNVTPSAPFSSPMNEMQNSAERDPEVDTPFPVVPGLDLLPGYLDESLHPYEENLDEDRQYEVGRDWIQGPLLGTGAFSTCYQARDVRTGILMAVKQVSFSRISEEDQERLEVQVEEEILLMSRLRHPHIVRLLGATRVSTSFSMFTEWMAGGSVAGLLERYGSFTEAVILNYTKQTLSGLAYLHDNMILHRDLKGANLLIDSTGQRLRIADFGTAARLASKYTITGEFQGQLLGTIAFMAPEVLRGADYGRSCDVWSVGCCMIEMATTKPPWGADCVSNQFKLMFKIASSDSPPPIPDVLSAAGKDLALSCLQIHGDDRLPAKELLNHPVFQFEPP